jgi:hypothetical protein
VVIGESIDLGQLVQVHPLPVLENLDLREGMNLPEVIRYFPRWFRCSGSNMVKPVTRTGASLLTQGRSRAGVHLGLSAVAQLL